MTTSAPLQVGAVLAGRYLLLEAVSDDGPAVLWRAEDEVLARTVAVKIVPATTKAAREAAQPFLDAAVRSGRVNHPGLARVYDAALDTSGGRGKGLAYVIREWVDGEPLDVHLAAVGALAGPDAADVLRQAADALTAAHAAGLVHGRLHPRNVIVAPGGRVRLTDATLAAALHGHPAAGPQQDTRDLAAVLYALVTARWPSAGTDQPPGSLAPAPVHDGAPLSPRQLRAGVSRALDTLVQRELVAPSTPTALADATDAAVAEARTARQDAAAPPAPPGRVRRRLPLALAGVVLVGVGVTGWMVGLAVGELKPREGAVAALITATDPPSPGATAAPPLDLSKVVVRDFDPGGDQQENADKVRNAVDGFPDTTWPTSRYRSPTFGGLKPGVGLLLDLGQVRALSTVTVGFSAAGAQVELRVADAPPKTAEQMRVVAAARDGKQVPVLKPLAGTKARFLLVWVTTLPKDGDGFRVGISELRIT